MSSKSLKSQLTSTIKDAGSELKKRIEQAENVLTNKTKHKEAPQLNIKTQPIEKQEINLENNVIKVVKENYTMPDFDYELLENLRKRIASTGNILSKSETVRVGLQALSKMTDLELSKLATTIVKLKPGRVPIKNKKQQNLSDI
ncbi:MAG: hypothetical protein HY819_24035 [Acidobacteria bacterium]|nr:hypothetical protein [Acidobacteriota bacterium]